MASDDWVDESLYVSDFLDELEETLDALIVTLSVKPIDAVKQEVQLNAVDGCMKGILRGMTADQKRDTAFTNVLKRCIARLRTISKGRTPEDPAGRVTCAALALLQTL